MTTATAITLADAQATPVSHVFTPTGMDDSRIFWFVDQSQANAIGYWKISFEIKQPGPASAGQSSDKRVIRVKIGLHEPVLENVTNNTISGIAPAPTVSYVPRSFHEFILPERSALLDRKSLRKMSSSLLADSNVINVVENLAFLN